MGKKSKRRGGQGRRWAEEVEGRDGRDEERARRRFAEEMSDLPDLPDDLTEEQVRHLISSMLNSEGDYPGGIPPYIPGMPPEMMRGGLGRPGSSAFCDALRRLLSSLFPTREQFESTFRGGKKKTSSSSSSSPPSSAPAAVEKKDPWEMLELERTGADEAAVKKAWKKQARRWHPDKNRDNVEEAEARMKEINAAKNACLGMLGDGTTVGDGQQKAARPCASSSDDDAAGDDGDDAENTTGPAQRHRRKNRRQARRKWEQEQEKQYNEHMRSRQQQENKMRKDRDQARARRKLRKKEAQMRPATRARKRRARAAQGRELPTPRWKSELERRKGQQAFHEAEDMFAEEERKDRERGGQKNKTGDCAQQDKEAAAPTEQKEADNHNDDDDDDDDDDDGSAAGNRRARRPFRERPEMEDSDHEAACAIRTGTADILYEMLMFRFPEQLHTDRVDERGNHLFHYCAYFNSVECLNVVLQLLGDGWVQAMAVRNADGATPFDVCQTSNVDDRVYDRFAALNERAGVERAKKRQVFDVRPIVMVLVPPLIFAVCLSWAHRAAPVSPLYWHPLDDDFGCPPPLETIDIEEDDDDEEAAAAFLLDAVVACPLWPLLWNDMVAAAVAVHATIQCPLTATTTLDDHVGFLYMTMETYVAAGAAGYTLRHRSEKWSTLLVLLASVFTAVRHTKTGRSPETLFRDVGLCEAFIVGLQRAWQYTVGFWGKTVIGVLAWPYQFCLQRTRAVESLWSVELWWLAVARRGGLAASLAVYLAVLARASEWVTAAVGRGASWVLAGLWCAAAFRLKFGQIEVANAPSPFDARFRQEMDA
jgi:curved DNA-binding protein CbpA